MCVWDPNLSHDYEHKRFAVDGDLIEFYSYEYGANQRETAEQFHAEPLEEYETRWLDAWVEHHDDMLFRTCKALEAENAKLRELIRDILPFAEVGMDDTCVTMRCCLYEECEGVIGFQVPH